MESWVGLLDCNNFFVSCERLFRPDLKGKPVLVLSSNDGCVVARSQEIKDSGIAMGVPYFKIKDIIKDIGATTFSSHFALYRDISRRVFEVMKTEIDTVEQYSVDEAFFVIDGDQAHVERVILRLKDKVEQHVGIPVSLGVAATKTRAKYASSVAKRTTGVCILDKKLWQEQLPKITLGEIWGVGFRSAEAYRKQGIVHVSDLVALERRQVGTLFGVAGVRLWLELQGISSAHVSHNSVEQKSILHSRSFRQTTNDITVLKDAISFHVREAAQDLRAMHKKTLQVQVSLGTSRYGDYLLQGGTATAHLTVPTNNSFVLIKAAQGLVEQLFKPQVPYKKAGILLTDFTPDSIDQLYIFSEPRNDKTEALMAVIDTINNQTKKGKGSVLLGSYLKTDKWQSSRTAKSPAYTTDWTDIATVKAQETILHNRRLY